MGSEPACERRRYLPHTPNTAQPFHPHMVCVTPHGWELGSLGCSKILLSLREACNVCQWASRKHTQPAGALLSSKGVCPALTQGRSILRNSAKNLMSILSMCLPHSDQLYRRKARTLVTLSPSVLLSSQARAPMEDVSWKGECIRAVFSLFC